MFEIGSGNWNEHLPVPAFTHINTTDSLLGPRTLVLVTSNPPQTADEMVGSPPVLQIWSKLDPIPRHQKLHINI